MSDVPASPKRTRSPINALKILNDLRNKRGLGKAKTVAPKPKVHKVTKQMKEELAVRVWTELYPDSVRDPNYVVSEAHIKAVKVEFEKRLKALKK
jgi:nitrogen regulatory protein PII-like uncharacterized protein